MNYFKAHQRILVFIVLSFYIFTTAAESTAVSGDLTAPAPELLCRSAVLYDLTTGKLLYEKNADEVTPPASMTKLMSLHLAYQAINAGKIGKYDLVPITAAASFKNSPPHSSLMFLEEGQKVTLLDIMIGLALPSGNDAGIALAQAITGDMASFVEAMNLECDRFGLTETSFVDSFGYSEFNQTTARDFARFCVIYLTEHPEALEELHSLTEYTYPREENIPPGKTSTHGPITQYNHNSLVGRYKGTDGLKTGFIDESGFNIALTTERDGRRLLAVLMGGPGKNSSDGNLSRAIDSTELMTWGFSAFTVVHPQLPALPDGRVWKGAEDYVKLSVAEPPVLTLPRWEAAGLKYEVELDTLLIAPVAAGTRAGSLICRNIFDEIIFKLKIQTEVELPEGSTFSRLRDSISMFFLRG
ncbi:MAG: D-alanyl-D-alanine carboxypeptidase [Spirochaetales bacterium]|nr:D-alanyl-D-alanine carboxypeptidase [Spirochaetales bacterium]